MGLFDKLNLDDIKERMTDLAQSGVAKSKQLAEIAKLKTNNMGEEDSIKKAYLEIGKLYYAERGMAPEGAYVALCDKINTSKANIEANNARIAELKEKEDLDDIDFEAEQEYCPCDETPCECECTEAPCECECTETPCDCTEAPAEPEVTGEDIQE